MSFWLVEGIPLLSFKKNVHAKVSPPGAENGQSHFFRSVPKLFSNIMLYVHQWFILAYDLFALHAEPDQGAEQL